MATVYAYDGDGRRVAKAVCPAGVAVGSCSSSTAGAAVTVFVYDASGRLAAEYGGAANPLTGTTYLTADHLGSTRMVTDAGANVVKRYDYGPFGEELTAGIDGRAAPYSTNQYPTATLDGTSEKFTSKERDAETGLDYLGARYFSAAQGRFTSPDWSEKPQAVPYADLRDPQSLNLYGYVRNSPLSKIDLYGHCGAPSGLQPGQTGICVASYIQTTWFHAPFRGDGRTTSPNGGTSRVEVRITVDPSKHAVAKTDEHVGRSGIICQDCGPIGKGGSQVGKPTTDDQGNTHLQVSQHGESWYKDISLGLISGTIDDHLNLFITPQGMVGIDSGSTARDFPSLEIYRYSMDSNGNISSTLIRDRPEASPNDRNGDLGKTETTIKEQEPR